MRYLVLIVALVLTILLCAAFGGFAGIGWLWLLPVCFLGSLVALAVLFFVFLWILSALVDTDKPQEKDNKFYRIVVSQTVELALWILRMRIHTVGLEQTPKSGRFLLVCNHLSLLDPVLLLAYFKKSQLAFKIQILDELPFVFIETVDKLKPKTVIMEKS